MGSWLVASVTNHAHPVCVYARLALLATTTNGVGFFERHNSMAKTTVSVSSDNNVTLRLITLDKIKVANVYQREVLKKAKVSAIASKFKKESFGTLVVGERSDGSLWCVDGMHRLEAARLLGMKQVPCSVFQSRGEHHEAQVFVDLNCERTSVNQVDIFRAALCQGEPETVAIQKLLDDRNLAVASGNSKHNIKAAAALRAIYKKGTLAEVLDCCLMVQQLDSKTRKFAFSNTMLHTLAEVLDKSNWSEETPVSIARVKSILSHITYQEWRTIENSSAGSSGFRGLKMARYFIEYFYNKSLLTKNRVQPSGRGLR